MLKEPENTIYPDSSRLQHGERREPHTWGKRNWFQLGVFFATIGIYIVMVYTAGIAEHWKSSVTEHEFRARLQTIDSPEITHPTVRFK